MLQVIDREGEGFVRVASRGPLLSQPGSHQLGLYRYHGIHTQTSTHVGQPFRVEPQAGTRDQVGK